MHLSVSVQAQQQQRPASIESQNVDEVGIDENSRKKPETAVKQSISGYVTGIRRNTCIPRIRQISTVTQYVDEHSEKKPQKISLSRSDSRDSMQRVCFSVHPVRCLLQ